MSRACQIRGQALPLLIAFLAGTSAWSNPDGVLAAHGVRTPRPCDASIEGFKVGLKQAARGLDRQSKPLWGTYSIGRPWWFGARAGWGLGRPIVAGPDAPRSRFVIGVLDGKGKSAASSAPPPVFCSLSGVCIDIRELPRTSVFVYTPTCTTTPHPQPPLHLTSYVHAHPSSHPPIPGGIRTPPPPGSSDGGGAKKGRYRGRGRRGQPSPLPPSKYSGSRSK